MNNLYNKLERKLGKYAIANLTRIVIFIFIFGYLISMLFPQMASMLSLEPYYILKGQVWRIISWIFIPPSSLSIWTVIMLYFYYVLGSSLETRWGRFRYNLYIIGGILISIVMSFIIYFLLSLISGKPVLFHFGFSTYYICMSILLAFSAVYPDMQVLLMFIIPIKIKWLGIINGLIIAYDAFTFVRMYFQTGDISFLAQSLAIISSFINFMIFFFSSRDLRRYSPKEVKRRNDFKKAYAPYTGSHRTDNARDAKFKQVKPRHVCCICGKTDLTDPDMTFRYCSKCSGGKEYCQDHIFNHEHS